MNTDDKREREKRLVCRMIALYCRKNHGGKTLCADCRELSEYACARLDKCRVCEKKNLKPYNRRVTRCARVARNRIFLFLHRILDKKSFPVFLRQ